ncbi:MAG: hypothetical protein JWL84_5850 [Rhodospirillales bacterium]|nr:hypothetical protein [Rhodospirillales bacterium]
MRKLFTTGVRGRTGPIAALSTLVEVITCESAD